MPAWQVWIGPRHLPWVLMGLQQAPTKDTGVSASQLGFGAPLPLPSQILETDKPPLADFMAKLQQGHPPPPFRAISYAQMAAKPPAALMSLAYMYVHKGGTIAPMSPLYSGPYQVLSSGPKIFKLQVGEWEEMVSIDHLKPH